MYLSHILGVVVYVSIFYSKSGSLCIYLLLGVVVYVSIFYSRSGSVYIYLVDDQEKKIGR